MDGVLFVCCGAYVVVVSYGLPISIYFFRAKIEKEYGEKLMNLAKTASGRDEIG